MGVRWSNGLVGLAVAHFPEHLLGVLGWLVTNGWTEEVEPIWRLLANAPYTEHLRAITYPLEFEDGIARKIGIHENELQLGRDQGIAGKEDPRPFAHGAHYAASRRIVLLEEIAIETKLLDTLDEAFKQWCKRNRRTGDVPYRIADAINSLNTHSEAAPNAIVVNEAWKQFRDFVIGVERIENLSPADRENYRATWYRKSRKDGLPKPGSPKDGS